MTPEEYRRQQDTILADLLQAVRGLLGVAPRRPTDEEWKAWIEALYPAVYRGRQESARLAGSFYSLQRRQQTRRTDDPRVLPRRYPPQALQSALDRTLRPKLASLADGQRLPAPVLGEAVAVIERHVAAAGRDAIADQARHDRQALGYARIATGESTCAFCLMLVSRGPVYKDASSALLRDGTSEPYHDRCDCLAVPVFREESWPGRAEYLAAQQLWRDQGGTLKGLRAHLDQADEQAQQDQAAAAAA
ncbi:VG15 protein [Kitasatospora indigofera]|uniref:VG15 protein n=1 Tax=Kitasatospora indigofera TaxID=67307 RepID=UPI00367B423E